MPSPQPYRGGWATPAQYRALQALKRKPIRPVELLRGDKDCSAYASLLSYGWAYYHQGLIQVTEEGREVDQLGRATVYSETADHRYHYKAKADNFRSQAGRTREFAEVAMSDNLITEEQYEYLVSTASWFARESNRWLALYNGHTLHPVANRVRRQLVTDYDYIQHSAFVLSFRIPKVRNQVESLYQRDSFWVDGGGQLRGPHIVGNSNIYREEYRLKRPRGIGRPERWWFRPEVKKLFDVELSAIFERPGGPVLVEGMLGPGHTRSYISDLEVAEMRLRGHPDMGELCERLRGYATPILDYLDTEVQIPDWLEAAWEIVPFIEARDDVLDTPTGGMPIIHGGTGHWGRPKQILKERVIPLLQRVPQIEDDPIDCCRVFSKIYARLAYCLRSHHGHQRIHPVEADPQTLLNVFEFDPLEFSYGQNGHNAKDAQILPFWDRPNGNWRP